jgi:hypothetical protein
MRPGDRHSRGLGEAPQAARGRMTVHPRAAPVEQDRPASTRTDRPVNGPADGWRQRDQDDLAAFAAHAQHPVAMFFAEIAMSAPVASKIRKPSSPGIATRAKSHGFSD